MAAPAYSYNYAPARPLRPERPRISVSPGGRTASREQEKPSGLALALVSIAAVLVVICVSCLVKLTLTAATVQVGIQTQAIEQALEEARYVGTTLEVQQTALSGSMRVKAAAAKLEMTMPDEVLAIALPADVVVANESGALSLAGSISVATAAR